MTCICLRDAHGWVCVNGRLELSMEEPTADEVPAVLELDEMEALDGRLPLVALDQLLSGLEIGEILSGTAYHPIRLPSADLQSGQWFSPQLWDRQQCQNHLGIGFASLVAEYTDPTASEAVPQAIRLPLERKLKTLELPYDGIEGLARSLRLDPLGQIGPRRFRCVSPIPLRFHTVAQDVRSRLVSVTVEAAPTAELPDSRVNGFAGQLTLGLGPVSEWGHTQDGESPAAGARVGLERYRKDLDAGSSEGRLKLVLAYKETLVEEREHLLSPRDPWLRACQFFDVEFTRSKKLLVSPGSNNINNLELGVARLLALAGLRVAWFGKESAERKRDILAYYESGGGRKTFAVVECTEVDPARKIDRAAASARGLDEWLSDPSCDVIPIVVTAAILKDVDLKAAFQAGVRLAGAEELARAWEAIERGDSTEQVLRASTEINPLEHPDILGL
jgi:hypothetical protein